MHVSPFAKGVNALLSPEREDAVAFVPHVSQVTGRALYGQRGIHRARHRERSVVVLRGEGSVRGCQPDGTGPVVRTRRIVRLRHDDDRRTRLPLVRRVERDMHGLVSRPEDLETIEQQLVVHPEDSRVLIVAVKLKILVREAHQPEQTG